MKIEDDGNQMVICTLETDAGYHTFRSGIEDRKHWTRHPETCELSQFINDNRKFSQIVVKYGDMHTRIK